MLASQPQDTQTRARRSLRPLAAVFGLLYAAWLLWGRAEPWERVWMGGVTLLFAALLSAVLTTRAARRVGPGRLRQAWGWMSAGLWAWAVGDAVRLTAQALAADATLRLSALEYLYIPGALAVWVGLLRFPRQPRPLLGRLGLLFDLTLVSTGAVTLAWLWALQPVVDAQASAGASGLVLLPLGMDLLTLLLLLSLFLLSDPRSLPAPLGWVGLGLLAYLFSDLAYTAMLAGPGYQSGTLLDLGWVIGDGLLAWAALQAPVAQMNAEPPPAGRVRRWVVRLQGLLPLLTVVVVGWYSLVEWQLWGRFNPTALWVTLILGLGLIARQGILTGEVEMQQYANLVNSVAEPTFVCDSRGRLRLVNPALLEAAGYTHANDLLGRPLQQLVHPAEGTFAWIAAGLKGGWRGEIHLRRRDGQTLPVSLALRPILPARWGRLALAGTAHDLSLQKRQQAALQQAYEQIAADRTELEQLNAQLEVRVAEKTADLTQALEQLEAQNRALQQLDELKTEFVSLVSHELRAPLTNISGGIELLLGGSYRLPVRARGNLTLVQAEIQRLSRFVETILDLSALDAGRLPLYPAPLLLAAAVGPLRQQFMAHAQAQRLRWDIPADLPPVLADEQALNSALFHLLDNAFKYTPSGEIWAQARAEGRMVRVEVCDQGPGLDEAQIPLLFERFFRSNAGDSQAVYGHGLGLYIVRRLVEAMGGEVGAENRPEGGACFWFRLPRLEERGEHGL